MGVGGSTTTPTTVEFITIILTAVTVVLAALAIVLALAGFVGYVQIKNGAELAARSAAEAKAAEAKAAEVTAIKVAELVPRLVEAAVSQKLGRDKDAGDAFADAEKGGDDADGR
jgi:hypothetical protein